MCGQNKVVVSQPHPDARRYLTLPFSCDLTSYGGNIVAAVSPQLIEPVTAYINRYRTEQCFETPNIMMLDTELRKQGVTVCFMAEYFLPDVAALTRHDCPYPLRLLLPGDFAHLYQPQWSNALCENRKALDMLAVGAFDGDKLVGLAGCSADCDTMWQIGIDVLPDYRKQGIAAALISELTRQVLQRGKVPFYCCAWSNIASARSAIACGFRPAWVQLTARELAFVEKLIQA